MVLSTITPLCAQEFIRTSQTLVADTAIIRETMGMSIIYTQYRGQGSFHCYDPYHDSLNLVSFDLPDNIIVMDFEVIDQKTIYLCGYIPGNPDRAILGQFGAGEFIPYLPNNIIFYYAILPNIDNSQINCLNKIDGHNYLNPHQFHSVAVGAWNNTGHCVVEFDPSSILSCGTTWTMDYITDLISPEIFDDVALSDSCFTTVSRRGNNTYLRQYKFSSGSPNAITNDFFWYNNVIHLNNDPIMPLRITGFGDNGAFITGLINSAYSQTVIYRVTQADFNNTSGTVNLLRYDSPYHPREIRYFAPQQIVYLLQEGFEKEWINLDCIYSFYPNGYGGVSANARYTEFKRIFSFHHYNYNNLYLSAVGQVLPDNIFLLKAYPLASVNCLHEFVPTFEISYDDYYIDIIPQSYGETTFEMQCRSLPLYKMPVVEFCR